MTESDSDRLNLIKNDVQQNKLQDSSLLFRKFILHELDFLKLANLACRAANNTNTKTTTNTTETQPNTNKSAPVVTVPPNMEDSPMNVDNGGGIFPETKEQQKIPTNDDLALKREIQSILNDNSLSPQSQSEKIMNVIYLNSKRQALAVTREQLDNPQKKALLKGGGNKTRKTLEKKINSKETKTKQKTETNTNEKKRKKEKEKKKEEEEEEEKEKKKKKKKRKKEKEKKKEEKKKEKKKEKNRRKEKEKKREEKN